MASKYTRFTEWLKNSGTRIIHLAFSEMEQIVPIPDYAYRHRPAWANSEPGSPFQKGWLNAGYVVSSVDLEARWVEFIKGEPQSRNKRISEVVSNSHSEVVSNNHIDEAVFKSLLQKGYDCYNQMKSDSHHRYLSWEHCHKVFKQRKENPGSVDNDMLCLHLAWFLASWGMLHNSFLLLKDYKVHASVVELLFNDEWNDLWDISAANLAQRETARKIIKLSERITQAYAESGCDRTPTETLLTKILLGTIGCVPAYDTYFKKAIASTGVSRRHFSENSLVALGTFYMEHNEQFEKLRSYCSQAGFEYPVAKILDMCFFEYGLAMKGTNRSEKK